MMHTLESKLTHSKLSIEPIDSNEIQIKINHDDDVFSNGIQLDKKQLNDLIGVLLHVQSKMRKK